MDSNLDQEIIFITHGFIKDLLKKFKNNEMLIKMDKCMKQKKHNTVLHVLYNIKNYTDAIVNRDSSIFENKVTVLPNLNLSDLFNTSNEQEKCVIWNHLTAMLFYKLANDNKDGENSELLVKLLSQVDKNVELVKTPSNNDILQATNQLSSMFINDKMDKSTQKVMGEVIGGVADCMGKLFEENSNPQDLMKSLMNMDPQQNPLMDMAKQMGQQMKDRVKSGEIKEEDLLNVKNRSIASIFSFL